jgi:integrase/recombinase XerD
MSTNLDDLLTIYARYMAAEGKSARTVESTQASVRPFVRYLDRNFEPEAVGRDDLRAYILHLQGRPKWVGHPTIAPDHGNLSPFTIATHVRTIKAFWSWLAREEFIAVDRLKDVATPKTPVRDVRILPTAACRSLLDIVPKKGFTGLRDRALLLALLGLGARITELTGLEIDDVDFDTGQVRVLGKGGKERRLFMSNTLFKAMHKYWHKERKSREGRLFFITRQGARMTRWHVNHRLHYYAERAGLGQYSVYPHKLRHTYATGFVRNGGNVFTLQKVLGHSTLEMSRHYAHMAEEDVEEQMRAFSPVENLARGG